MSFVAKSKTECRWDIVSLGEVMLRLDPGEGRVATTRNFRVWEGGGKQRRAWLEALLRNGCDDRHSVG